MSTDPFAPEGVEWTALSPRLIAVRLVESALGAAVLVAVVVVAALLIGWSWLWWALALPVLGFAETVLLEPRRVRAWGYAEREDDLLVRHGILWRSLSVVPYGRMQYVDVDAGPLQRIFGVATVQLHTASADTDAKIPGLVPQEAARLRDRLTERGQARLAGL